MLSYRLATVQRGLLKNTIAATCAVRSQSSMGGRPPAPPGRPGAPPAAPPAPKGIIDANGNVLSAKKPSPASAPASKPGAAASGAPPRGSTPFVPPETIVMDVTEANFVDNVVQCPVPVVLYFTATWCKPCQTLGPKLEAVARSAKGAIRLAKVDVDVARALAAQLQVSSVPTVFGVVGGKAVANFQGAVNDAELRGFFDQLLTAGEKLGAVATPVSMANDAISEAQELIDGGRHADALVRLPAVLEKVQKMRDLAERQLKAAGDAGDKQAAQAAASGGTSGPLWDLDQVAARAAAGIVRALAASASEAAASGATSTGPSLKEMNDQAAMYADMLRGRYKGHAKHPDVTRALAAIDILTAAAAHGSQLAPLLEAVSANPGDAGARFALAEAQMAVGQHQAAVDNCLAVIKAEGAAWREGAAKSLLLKIFEILGAADPIANAGRKALSKLLFR